MGNLNYMNIFGINFLFTALKKISIYIKSLKYEKYSRKHLVYHKEMDRLMTYNTNLKN